MGYKAVINDPSYLCHFNKNHDPKNGRFTFKKAWETIDTAVGKGYDAVEKVAKGAYKGIKKEFKDPSSSDFDGYSAPKVPSKPIEKSTNQDDYKTSEKKPPEAFKTPELDTDYIKVKTAKIPELQSKLPWLNDDDDANKVWGEQNVRAADIGLEALNRIGRQGYDENIGITNGDRSWFVIEDQTIGMPSIAWLASKGKNEKEIASIINSNYRCQQANYKYEGQFNWLKNREEYEKYANDVPYKDLVWELSEYAGYDYSGQPDDFIKACVKIANEYIEPKVKHSIVVNCGNYLIHYNKNHSKTNGQFTSGDGDGDGIVDDHHNSDKNKVHTQTDEASSKSGDWKNKRTIISSEENPFKTKNKGSSEVDEAARKKDYDITDKFDSIGSKAAKIYEQTGDVNKSIDYLLKELKDIPFRYIINDEDYVNDGFKYLYYQLDLVGDKSVYSVIGEPDYTDSHVFYDKDEWNKKYGW